MPLNNNKTTIKNGRSFQNYEPSIFDKLTTFMWSLVSAIGLYGRTLINPKVTEEILRKEDITEKKTGFGGNYHSLHDY